LDADYQLLLLASDPIERGAGRLPIHRPPTSPACMLYSVVECIAVPDAACQWDPAYNWRSKYGGMEVSDAKRLSSRR
jgi:hypothetical protein